MCARPPSLAPFTQPVKVVGRDEGLDLIPQSGCFSGFCMASFEVFFALCAVPRNPLHRIDHRGNDLIGK